MSTSHEPSTSEREMIQIVHKSRPNSIIRMDEDDSQFVPQVPTIRGAEYYVENSETGDDIDDVFMNPREIHSGTETFVSGPSKVAGGYDVERHDTDQTMWGDV